MSSRVLRKLGLQGEKEITCINDDASDPEADFSNSSGAKKKQLNINRYDLLNQQSHSESEVKEDDDHETAGSLNAQDGAIDLKDASRRKKKKKKKKPGKLPSSNTRSSEDNIEDEVERSVREVNKILGEIETVGQVHPADSGSSSLRKGVLNVEHRALNPNNELRRIFGSKILQTEQIKKRGRSRGHIKSTFLVTPKENWPPIGKSGLSMKLVESKNGINYFAYEHSLNYQQVQMKFLEAVESLNPDNIVSIINMSPYHVDGLLQLSEFCRLSEDLSMAAELVQRALYCLEMAFHPSFSLSSGNSRLDYRKQENRSLFIALFKHALFVGSRACYRTALEFCKLILSLEPEKDPLAVVLILDFFALRCQEYEWLIRISNEWECTRNLSQLPNFAYSLAMAQFQLGETEVAHALLQKALIKFPGVLLPLMDKCGAVVDSRVSSSAYFSNAQATQSKSLTQLETMYVERCYHAWKEADLLPWLEMNTHQALDRVESGDPLVAEWKEARLKRYHSTPRNIHRHIILSDLKETPLLLAEEHSAPLLNFDPLPPLDTIDLYSRPVRPRAHDNNGPLAILFRSIVPSFNINQVATEEPTDEGGLRRSVALLLDAMRDLLSNIHLPDVPGDGDVEDVDDVEDDATL